MNDEDLRKLGFLPYHEGIKFLQPNDNFVYIWKNSRSILGVGRSSFKVDNKRVNPRNSQKDILACKDSGKKFYASYIAKETGENMELWIKPDNSNKTSRNTSELEIQTKNELTQGKFAIIDGEAFSKQELGNKLYQKVIGKFGKSSDDHISMQDIVMYNCKRDGDLFSRQKHPQAQKALKDIMDEFCLFETK